MRVGENQKLITRLNSKNQSFTIATNSWSRAIGISEEIKDLTTTAAIKNEDLKI